MGEFGWPPGPDTAYRKITRRRFDIEWTLDAQAIAYDQKSDGMYPLLCNDPSLSPAQVLTAHKGQPCIEKRFEQLKSVHEIAPVFLKNEARIEALFTLYFLALLVQALIERELRQRMQAANIDQLPSIPRPVPAGGPPPNTSCGCSASQSACRCWPMARSFASSRQNSPSCSAKSSACWECLLQPTSTSPEATFRGGGNSGLLTDSMCGM